jgi:hypothetical protein
LKNVPDVQETVRIMSEDKPDEAVDSDQAADKTEVKVMHVQTRFTTMATRTGGMARKEAMDRADTFVEKIAEKYPDWVDKDMKVLVEIIARIKSEGGFTQETYDDAYRGSCRVRDLGGTFGYELTTKVGDSLCELIFRLAEGKLYSQEALDTHMNALRLVCTPQFRGVPVSSLTDLTDSLAKLVNNYPDPDAELKRADAERRAKLVKSD